ncbi:hypothetical protein Hanom_Chr07g00590721 [Helianthus anomalus]
MQYFHTLKTLWPQTEKKREHNSPTPSTLRDLGYSWCGVSSDEQGEGTRSDSWFSSDSQVSRVLDGVRFLWLVITRGLGSGLGFGRSSPTFSGIMSRRNQARKANGSRSGEETDMNTDA